MRAEAGDARMVEEIAEIGVAAADEAADVDAGAADVTAAMEAMAEATAVVVVEGTSHGFAWICTDQTKEGRSLRPFLLLEKPFHHRGHKGTQRNVGPSSVILRVSAVYYSYFRIGSAIVTIHPSGSSKANSRMP